MEAGGAAQGKRGGIAIQYLRIRRRDQEPSSGRDLENGRNAVRLSLNVRWVRLLY